MKAENLEPQPAQRDGEASTDESRRDALRKIAGYGAYVPPAMIALLSGSKAQAQSNQEG